MAGSMPWSGANPLCRSGRQQSGCRGHGAFSGGRLSTRCNFRERHYGGGRWCSVLAGSSLSSCRPVSMSPHQQAGRRWPLSACASTPVDTTTFRSPQPFCQLRPPPSPRDIAHRNGDGLLLSNQHHEPLPSGDAGVEEIALQHGVMLREDWDNHGGIFRPLALVNGRRVGRHQHIEFTESVLDGSAVEANSNFPRIDVDIVDGADVAVVDLLVVVVLDLHHLVAGCESPAESFNFAVAGEIKRRL